MLKGGWIFNEPPGAGPLTNDFTGHRNNGTITGATRAPGGILCDGDYERVVIPTALNLLESKGTIVFGYKKTVTPPSYYYWYTVGDAYTIFSLYADTSPSWVRFGINSTVAIFTSWGNLFDGGWHPVGLTWDDDTNKRELYVDGILRDDDTTSFTWPTLTTEAFNLGARSNSTERYVGGVISNFYIFNEILGADSMRMISADPYCLFIRPSRAKLFYVAVGAIQGVVTDGFEMGETLARIATLQGVATDGLKGGDASVELAQFFPTASDGAVMGDAASAFCTFQLASVDGMDAGDAPAAQGTFQGVSVDGLTLGETIVAAAILTAIAADGAEFGDTPVGEIVGALLGEAFDGVKIGDTSSAAGTFLKSVADGFKLGEALTALLTALASAADGVEIGDAAQGGLLLEGTSQDGLVLSENLQRVLRATREAADGIVGSDAAAAVATFRVTAADGLRMGEALAALMTFYALASDGFELSDDSFHIEPGAPGEVVITFTVGGATLTFAVRKGGIAFGSKAAGIEIN